MRRQRRQSDSYPRDRTGILKRTLQRSNFWHDTHLYRFAAIGLLHVEQADTSSYSVEIRRDNQSWIRGPATRELQLGLTDILPPPSRPDSLPERMTDLAFHPPRHRRRPSSRSEERPRVLPAVLLDAARAELESFAASSWHGRQRLVGRRDRRDGLSVAEELGPVRGVAVVIFLVGSMMVVVGRGRGVEREGGGGRVVVVMVDLLAAV